MVRDNLLELDDLKREHDAIYSELLSCYGLEKCLKGFDIDLATSETDRQSERFLGNTRMIGYCDTLREWQECHTKQIFSIQ